MSPEDRNQRAEPDFSSPAQPSQDASENAVHNAKQAPTLRVASMSPTPPGVQAPGMQAPGTQAPGTHAPGMQAPGVQTNTGQSDERQQAGKSQEAFNGPSAAQILAAAEALGLPPRENSMAPVNRVHPANANAQAQPFPGQAQPAPAPAQPFPPQGEPFPPQGEPMARAPMQQTHFEAETAAGIAAAAAAASARSEALPRPAPAPKKRRGLPILIMLVALIGLAALVWYGLQIINQQRGADVALVNAPDTPEKEAIAEANGIVSDKLVYSNLEPQPVAEPEASVTVADDAPPASEEVAAAVTGDDGADQFAITTEILKDTDTATPAPQSQQEVSDTGEKLIVTDLDPKPNTAEPVIAAQVAGQDAAEAAQQSLEETTQSGQAVVAETQDTVDRTLAKADEIANGSKENLLAATEVPAETAPSESEQAKSTAAESSSASVAAAPLTATAVAKTQTEGTAETDSVTATNSEAVPPGNYRVQLGSYRDPDVAEVQWQKIKVAQAESLDGLARFIARADLGAEKGIYYRLQVGNFVDSAAARAVCEQLAANDQACLPVKVN